MEKFRNRSSAWVGFLVTTAAWLGAACSDATPPSEAVTTTRQALPAETRRLTVVLPPGAGFDTVGLAATDSLTLRDRARVETAAGEPRRISNSGPTTTLLSFDSRAGTTTSAAPVSMLDRAVVTGDVVSSGLVTRGTDTTVTGSVQPNTPLVFDQYSFSVSLPASGSTVTVAPDASRSLTPGSYAGVTVSARATLSLVAGSYYFDSLTVEPTAFFSVDTRNGPVNVYARTGLVFRGIPTFNGPNDRLFIAYLGTAAPSIEKSPDATIVAPFAPVRLGIGGSPYSGAYFAKSLDLDPDVVLQHRPFSGWPQVPFDVVPIFQCAQRRAGGAWVGHFGYRNPGSTNVTIPVGPNNRFSPDTQNRQQPTTFLPGTQTNQFAVTWVTHPASWFLNGIEAAPDTTKLCPQSFGLTAIADTTVSTNFPRANFGTLTKLSAGENVFTLVQFDRAAVVRELGPSRLIRSARLELTLSSATPSGPLEAVAVRPRFGEQTATWNCARDTNLGNDVEFCHPFDRWAVVPTGARWESPFEAGAPSAGTVQAGKVVFDVTAQLQRFLGPERIRALPSFLVRPSVPALGATVFEARERGAAFAPRLVIEADTFTDFDTVGATNDAERPFDVVVDATVVPRKPPHPPMTTGAPTRAVAAVRGPDGRQSEFTDRELIVHTADDAALTAVRTRLNATLLYSAPLALPGMPRAHLLRIDTTRTDPGIIVPTLLSRVPGFRGRQRISSDSGLRTLAALADESSRGTLVGLNWLGSGAMATTDTLAREVLQDGISTIPDDPSTALDDGIASRNPKDWPHFKPQMHDVVRAWKALLYSRRSFIHTNVAVHDGGFHSDHFDGIDLGSPACFTAGCENLVKCTSGKPCPWHGTDSINAGFGHENNSIGAAGPGGPASKVTAHVGLADPITFSSFVAGGVLSGQRILSMSYGGELPDWAIGLTVAGFAVAPPVSATLIAGYAMLEAETALARGLGVLLFAAAGNREIDGVARNVDARRCFVVKEPLSDVVAGVFGAETPLKVETCPWEEALWWPCESAGVNCVEGSNFTDKNLHPGSNYGSDDVQYRAVFTSLVKGAGDDVTAGDTFRFVSGTSTSTPVVAGIAALTWAGSNGAKSAGDIERCLLKGGKFVNAFDSMRCGLDGPADFPPAVIIERPTHGSNISGIGMIQSRAIAADVESGRINHITWFGNGASLAPFSSYGQTVSHFLNSSGNWNIEARATDSAGNVGSDRVTVNVGPIAPILSVTTPATEGAVVHAGLPADLIGKVNNRGPGPINCNSMKWSAKQSGTTLFSGRAGCVQRATFTTPGTVVITVTFTDPQGTGSATRTINVVNDGKPHVWITNPPPSTEGVLTVVVEDESPVVLGASATPAGTSFTYNWQFELPGGVPIPIGTQTATISFFPPIVFPENCNPVSAYVSVAVTDPQGNVSQPPDRRLIQFNPATCDPH